MVTRVGTPERAQPGRGPERPRRWLVAATMQLAPERLAVLAFDRDGHGRLSLVLDRPATPADVEALEEAASLLPLLRLADLDTGAAYPRRHATHFGLPEPLPPGEFNRASEVELVAPPGGARIPAWLGEYGLPAHVRSPWVAPPAGRDDHPAHGALERALLAAGRLLVARTRVPGPTLAAAALAATLALFVLAFAAQTWNIYNRYGSYGFDVGIFDQGTWLLANLHRPFVTIRGLNLFGDHASYILVLVAPLYRLWPDARLLLALQVVFLALPAIAVYRIGTRLGHQSAGLAVAVAYLAYPAMQWAIIWQFHPETIGAGCLAMAALAADRRRWRAMAVWIGLALLCKEDIGLVVAGFGALLWLLGQRRVGWRVALAGIGWFALATFVLVPLANGHSSPHLELNYGLTGSGPGAVVGALPVLAGRALATALSGAGMAYLALVFLPLLGLPLLDLKWLLPVAAPLFLNLAATHPYQHQLHYQYLATSAPFLVLAAVAGLARLRRRNRRLLVPALVALVLVACLFDWAAGPALWSRAPVDAESSPADAARARAIAIVSKEPAAAVSAQYDLVTHLDHRRWIYEFPNPFRAVNWGLEGDEHTQAELDRIRWVVVDRALLSGDDRRLLERLAARPEWRRVLDDGDIVVLWRPAAPADGGRKG